MYQVQLYIPSVFPGYNKEILITENIKLDTKSYISLLLAQDVISMNLNIISIDKISDNSKETPNVEFIEDIIYQIQTIHKQPIKWLFPDTRKEYYKFIKKYESAKIDCINRYKNLELYGDDEYIVDLLRKELYETVALGKIELHMYYEELPSLLLKKYDLIKDNFIDIEILFS